MNRFAWSLAALAVLPALPALAAPPSAFKAVGTAETFATADSPAQSTPITFFYQGGHIRIDMQPPGSPKSIVLAQKGSKLLYLLDPSQKVAFQAKTSQMSGTEGMPTLEQLMDLRGWKTQLVKNATRLPGSEVKAGQKCSLWRKVQGKNTLKIWFADALELPMQIDGSQGGQARFRIALSQVSPGSQPSHLFAIPAGYQKTAFTASQGMPQH